MACTRGEHQALVATHSDNASVFLGHSLEGDAFVKPALVNNLTSSSSDQTFLVLRCVVDQAKALATARPPSMRLSGKRTSGQRCEGIMFVFRSDADRDLRDTELSLVSVCEPENGLACNAATLQ